MKKQLCFFLALILILGMMPAAVFAADPQEPLKDSGALLSVTSGSAIQTEFTMNTTSTSAKLYAAADSGKETDLLSGITLTDGKYKALLEAGDYILDAVAADGITDNGSILISVSEDRDSFQLVTVTISCTEEQWICGTDFSFADVDVRSGGSRATVKRTVTMGSSTETNKKTVPALNGDAVTVTLIPSAAKQLENYVKTTGNRTVNPGYDTLSVEPAVGTSLQVTYPYGDADADGNNDYILEVGQLISGSCYRYTYETPLDVSQPQSDTVTASFTGLVKKGVYYYRVTNPSNKDAVTYGNFITLSSSVNTAAVTADNLYLGKAQNKHTVIDDYSGNTYDSGDLYLSVRNTSLTEYAGFDGAAGMISMKPGDEINLYPFRNWLAIESTSNAKVIEPDFHVQVVTLEGDSPVCVSERLNDDDSKHSFRVEANEEGAALILVTYDAMTSDVAMGKKASMDKMTFFSAIWPENTGVLVVSVGKDNDIATGMTISEELNASAAAKLAGKKLDAELDVLYYTGTQGARYSFKPEAGTVVTRADPVYTDGRLGFGAFSTSGVSTAADGTVTIYGLKQGKTLVKLVNGDKVAYQVIRARQTEYKVYTGSKAEESNLLYDSSTGFENTGLEVKAGDRIFVQYSDLQHPANKLSGIYNMSAALTALGEDGSISLGTGNQYLFGATAAAHGVAVTVPKYWTGEDYSFCSVLRVSGFGSCFGQHRELAYETGKSPNFVAVQQNGYFGNIPGYTLNLTQTPFVRVTLAPVSHETDKTDESVVSGVSFSVTDEDGTVSEADRNGTFSALPGLTYSYKASAGGYEYKTGTITVPAEQTADMTVDVVLEKSAEGAWDGSAKSEPRLAEGVYQIGCGAELAWLSNEIFEGRCLDANILLTADLDMGKYPFTPMGRKTNANWMTGETARDYAFKGVFDGNGKTIRNLYVEGNGNTALFAYVKNAVIKDFTIEGLVESTGANTAAVAANVNGSAQFCGIISKVEIRSLGNMVGAIIGSVGSAGVKVSQCANMGSISGKMSVAGLVGSTSSYLFTAEECFNTGDISGTCRIGGIIGYANGAAGKTVTIDSCYNAGAVTASAASNGTAGGIVGETGSYVTITSCYNAGAVTSAKAAAAISAAYGAKDVTVTDTFYLEGAADTKGTEKTSAQLKMIAGALGTSYISALGRYPALSWQLEKHIGDIVTDGTSRTVTVSAQKDGSFLLAGKTMTVVSSLAEDYGYTDEVNPAENVSALDVLVRAHEIIYADTFTSQTAINYLDINTSGFITKIFGKETGSCGFTINDQIPVYGDMIESIYGNYYNSYLAGQAAINSNDTLQFFIYQDEWASDNYSFFADTKGVSTSFSAEKNKSVDLSVKGYGIGWTGSNYNTLSAVLAACMPLEGVQIAVVNKETGTMTDISGAVTDADGNVALTFSSAGKYTIAAYMPDEKIVSESKTPVIMNLAEITVTEPGPQQPRTITVKFRLIGAEESKKDIDMSTGEGGVYVTWIQTEKYTLPSGSTVGDLFKKALDKAGLSYEGLSGNYISSIGAPEAVGGYNLAEFTNGYYSGWMYTVNGTHPASGLNDQVLQSNDEVIWHYVNDYRYEVEDWFDGTMGDESVWSQWLLASDKNPVKTTDNQPSSEKQNAADASASEAGMSAVTAETVQSVFTDVSSDACYAESVAWAFNHQITAGTGDKTFGAGRNCTRAQMITFLWNMMGKPAAKSKESFADVSADSWFSAAAAWGKETGIISGKGDGKFGAEDAVTREQLVTMLWNLAGKPPVNSTDNVFKDIDSSAYYATAAAWAEQQGITAGIGNGLFGTGLPCTREQIVTMLFKYASWAEK